MPIQGTMPIFADRIRGRLRPAMACGGIVLVVLITLGGCSRPQEGAAHGEQAPAPVAADATRQLAYAHSVRFDAAPERLPAIHAAGLAACRDAGAAACTLLESRIDSEPRAGAALKFRARPQVIPKLIAALGAQAELAHQSTSAEDLSGPIADNARQLAMLEDYRARLEDMRGRAANDIDALIKVNHELADVQATLEQAAGKRAELAQRVETEILQVAISSEAHRPFWTPIGRALRGFGGNLAKGIAYAITALPYLLPWLVMIALAVWALRRGLRRWRGPRRHEAGRPAPHGRDQG